MASDRTPQNAPENELPQLAGAVRPLRPDQLRQTLASKLVPVVDKIRQLNATFGTRPYRVFLVHVLWSGGRIGAGTPAEVSRREILPTPKVVDLSSTVEMISAFGRTEDGSVVVEEISDKFSEDDLMGGTPDLVDAANPNTGRSNAELIWEVQEQRGTEPTPVVRHYTPAAAPMRRPPMCWRISLNKRDADRARPQGAPGRPC